MIPDFKTYLKESLWADVQSQASGDTEKKEDDVNLRDYDQLYDYIEEHYTYGSDVVFLSQKREMVFGIEIYIKRAYNGYDLFLFYQDSEKRDIPEIMVHCDVLDNFPDKYNEFSDKCYNLYDELRKKYKIYRTENWAGNSMYGIDPKNGVVDNKFFLDVLDFITEYIPNPKIKKK